MGEFFKGWRHKIGVVTLLMACGFAAGWVRSLKFRDVFNCRSDDTNLHFVGSNCGRLSWQRMQEPQPFYFIPTSFYFALPPIPNDTHSTFENGKVEWHWKAGGFEFGQVVAQKHRWIMTIWEIPYGSIVIPLTVLSAWLLLTKARQSTPEV